MNKLMGVVVGVNLAVACAMMQGCKAPKAGSASARPARAQKIEQPASAPEQLPAPAPAPVVAEVQPLPAPPAAPIAEVKPLPPAPEAAPVPEVAPAAETTVYVVKSGDMLSKICRRHGVKQSEVLKLNPGLQPNKLFVGKKIKLPAGVKSAAPAKAEAAKEAKPAPAKESKKDVKAEAAKPAEKKSAAANVKAPATTKQAFKSYVGPTKEYVVVAGDNVGKVAYSCGISIRALKELNGLKSNNLRVGQKLKVPAEKQVAAKDAPKDDKKDAVKTEPAKKDEAKKDDKKEVKPEAPKAEAKPAAAPAPAAEAAKPEAPKAAAPAPAAVPAPAAEAAAPAPAPAPAPAAVTHVVKAGEDLVTIAIRYGTSLMELKELNGLPDENVKPGQVLKLPAGVKAQ